MTNNQWPVVLALIVLMIFSFVLLMRTNKLWHNQQELAKAININGSIKITD